MDQVSRTESQDLEQPVIFPGGDLEERATKLGRSLGAALGEVVQSLPGSPLGPQRLATLLHTTIVSCSHQGSCAAEALACISREARPSRIQLSAVTPRSARLGEASRIPTSNYFARPRSCSPRRPRWEAYGSLGEQRRVTSRGETGGWNNTISVSC